MRRQIKHTLVAVLLLLACCTAAGQLEEVQYFQDEGSGTFTKIYDYEILADGFIISGLVETVDTKSAVLMRLDSEGQLLWSTANDTLLGPYWNDYFTFYISPEGIIYGMSGERPLWSSEDNHLWKVDMQTGEILWVSYFEYNLRNPVVYDLDEERYITAFEEPNGGTMLQIRNKSDGSIFDESFFTYAGGQCDVKVDNAKKSISLQVNSFTNSEEAHYLS